MGSSTIFIDRIDIVDIVDMRASSSHSWTGARSPSTANLGRASVAVLGNAQVRQQHRD
jgi:hypothetical protein